MSKATDASPETISMQGLVDAFRRIHLTMPDRRFAFVLGAGASKSSGIQLAGEMVADWVGELHRASATAMAQGVSRAEWANATNLRISAFDPSNPASAYSALYQRMFQHDPEQGYAYLEAQMAQAEPSYGYSVLGRIMADTRHHVVITVNFDNLVADSLSIFSTTYPLVCGHESLAHFVRADLRRPLVLKVHRDLLMQPKSVPDDLANVAPQFNDAIVELLQKYTPIVLGYGGNDDSLMASLESIPEHKIPGGVYWCYREPDGAPPPRIQTFVAKQRGYLIPIMGFDELMVSLGGVLVLSKPDELIMQRAKQRAEKLLQQEKGLQRRLEEAASKPIVLSTVAKIADHSDAKEAEAVLLSLTKVSGETLAEKPWWMWAREAASEPDIEKRDFIYRQALDALPNSVELMVSYANFLTNVSEQHDAGEDMYKLAIEADPKDVTALSNYASFLTVVRKSYDAAQDLYVRATHVDSPHASVLGGFAAFLTVVRKDYDAAKAMFHRAIEADRKNAVTRGNYANLLLTLGQIVDGLAELRIAFALLEPDEEPILKAECWMYAFCCRDMSEQPVALSELKVLTANGVCTGEWDFAGVIAQAVKLQHAHSQWLPKLADLLAGRADVGALSEWDAWRDA